MLVPVQVNHHQPGLALPSEPLSEVELAVDHPLQRVIQAANLEAVLLKQIRQGDDADRDQAIWPAHRQFARIKIHPLFGGVDIQYGPLHLFCSPYWVSTLPISRPSRVGLSL